MVTHATPGSRPRQLCTEHAAQQRRAAAAHRHRLEAACHSLTGGRLPHHRRAAATHTADGRPPSTLPMGGRGPHQRRPAAARKARARHSLRPVRGPGGRSARTGTAAAPTKGEAGVRRGGATRARGRGDGVGGGYPQFQQCAKKSTRRRAYLRTEPLRTGGRWGQGHREKCARKESARTTESRVADVGGCTGLTEPSTRALAPLRRSRTPLRTPTTTSERAWARCTTAATPHTPSGTQSRGWPARGRTQS